LSWNIRKIIDPQYLGRLWKRRNNRYCCLLINLINIIDCLRIIKWALIYFYIHFFVILQFIIDYLIGFLLGYFNHWLSVFIFNVVPWFMIGSLDLVCESVKVLLQWCECILLWSRTCLIYLVHNWWINEDIVTINSF